MNRFSNTSLHELWKNDPSHKGLMYLKNKTPVWNEGNYYNHDLKCDFAKIFCTLNPLSSALLSLNVMINIKSLLNGS